MEVIRGLENWKPARNPVVTVGSFDGVHLAHKAVISLLNHYADVENGESVLVTFSPHPRMVLPSADAYDHRFRLLSTDEEKVSLLARTGLGRVLILHFDEALSNVRGELAALGPAQVGSGYVWINARGQNGAGKSARIERRSGSVMLRQ